MKALLVAGFVLLMVSGASQAQTARESKISGEVLIGLCTSSEEKSVEGCTAYIDGVLDSALTYQQLRPASGPSKLPAYICVPGAMTGVQLRQAVIDAYKKNPQPTRFGAGIILSAMANAYPCQGGGKNR